MESRVSGDWSWPQVSTNPSDHDELSMTPAGELLAEYDRNSAVNKVLTIKLNKWCVLD